VPAAAALRSVARHKVPRRRWWIVGDRAVATRLILIADSKTIMGLGL
jgi:hypothetical protein